MLSSAQTPVSNEKPRQSAGHGCPSGCAPGLPWGQHSYVATAATVGRWSLDAQHGGPPSALAARALERHGHDERQRLARVAVDILRPIPVGKLSVRTRLVRPGRRITLAEAVMEADGHEVMHARGWRIERPAGDVPEIVDGASAAPLPAAGAGEVPSIFTREPEGYLASIEWRFPPPEFPPHHARDAPATAGGDPPRVPLAPGGGPPARGHPPPA